MLLDAEQGGYWSVSGPAQQFVRRAYTGHSSVSTTEFTVAGQPFSVIDWMPLDADFTALCCGFSAAPAPVTATLQLRTDYGLRAAPTGAPAGATAVGFPALGLWLWALHPVR